MVTWLPLLYGVEHKGDTDNMKMFGDDSKVERNVQKKSFATYLSYYLFK